jgi:predicted transcriptional regulator of viral defense system
MVCSKIAPDAVIAYHTALRFYGKAYSLWSNYVCLSHTRLQPFEYEGQTFKSVLFPQSLVEKGEEMHEVNTEDSHGEDLWVTSLERTMVDVMQRPDLAGGWEEVWRSLEMVEYFDLAAVCRYVELLGNATTAAKVGLFLEQHKEQLMVDEEHLERLARLRPKSPHYLDRSHKGSNTLLSTWNLVVPNMVFERRWEEQ